MKKLSIIFLLSLCFIKKIHADIPIEQTFSLYENTKDEYKEISPIWGQIDFISDLIKNIRFFGHFTSNTHPDLKPYPCFDGKELSNPQDPISGLLQYLFPSLDGYILVHNARDYDPIGYITQDKDLQKLNNIIFAVTHFKTNKINKEEFKTTINAILPELSQKNPKIGNRKLKNNKRNDFNKINRDFINILTRAIIAENDGSFADKYPSSVVIPSLMAFALKIADNADEIYQHFDWLFKQDKILSHFERTDYDALKQKILSQQENNQDLNETLKLILGYIFFEQKVPKPLNYISTFFEHNGKKIAYPDCGEISLLNFLYYVLGEKGRINFNILDSISIKDDLKAFFKKYPHISLAGTRQAHADFSNIVSNQNDENADPSLRIKYRQDVCNIQGTGIVNMLNVLARLMPDACLNKIWPKGEQEIFTLAAEKLTHLCTFFSHSNFELKWKVEGKKELNSLFSNIRFYINDEASFKWLFLDGHFEIRNFSENVDQLFKKIDLTTLPEHLLFWLIANTEFSYKNELSSTQIFGLNLQNLQQASLAIDHIIRNKWEHLYPHIPLMIKSTFPQIDLKAQKAVYTLFHTLEESQNEAIKKYFDWLNYLPPSFSIEKKKLVELASQFGLLGFIQRIGIDDAIKSGSHRKATQYGHMSIVKWFCAQQSDLPFKASGKHSSTLPEIACEYCHLDLFKYFGTIKEIDPSFQNPYNKYTYLHNLICDDDRDGDNPEWQEFADYLFSLNVPIESKDYQGLTAFNQACLFEKLGVLKYLYTKNPNIDIETRDNSGHTPLLCSSVRTTEMAKYLLDIGANIHAKNNLDQNALHRVSSGATLELVKFFLEELNFDVNEEDLNGKKPIDLAIEAVNVKNVDYLLSKGAITNGEDIYEKMIHSAFKYNHDGLFMERLCNLFKSSPLIEKYHDVFNEKLLNFASSKEAVPMWKFVKLIEQFSANIHIKNADGMTPFLVCCKESKLEEMKYFIEKGANVDDIDAQGRNARQIALDEGHLDIDKYIDDGFVVKK
ncbi:MAG: hypothetical protein Q8S31_03085 [Alphaproteobacteria bacterium]|nr:hypothetical protein [Alphaproteobacteria bacterium]